LRSSSIPKFVLKAIWSFQVIYVISCSLILGLVQRNIMISTVRPIICFHSTRWHSPLGGKLFVFVHNLSNTMQFND